MIPNLNKKSIREQSFHVHGGKLFNSIPKNIRNMAGNNVDEFKEKLDLFLQSIPDEPKVEGYVPSACDDLTAKPSNSIIFQCKQKMRNCWQIMKDCGLTMKNCNLTMLISSEIMKQIFLYQ